MFPKKKENENQKAEDGGQKTEEKNVQCPTPNVECKSDEVKKSLNAGELQKQIESLKKEKDDIFAKLQRVAADYDNYQKRSQRQIADSVNYEKDKMVKTLLPVLDNFDYILTNTSCGATDETLLKGVKIIYDQMLDVLKGHGIEQIKSAGEQFNPAHHEAITHRCEKDKENGVVLEELQKGYKISGRLIRPSRVVVNKLPSTQPAQQPDEPETKDTQ
jgi:molecular chaperone GrpE